MKTNIVFLYLLGWHIQGCAMLRMHGKIKIKDLQQKTWREALECQHFGGQEHVYLLE